jgi:hypothetical protein
MRNPSTSPLRSSLFTASFMTTSVSGEAIMLSIRISSAARFPDSAAAEGRPRPPRRSIGVPEGYPAKVQEVAERKAIIKALEASHLPHLSASNYWTSVAALSSSG